MNKRLRREVAMLAMPAVLIGPAGPLVRVKGNAI